MRTTAASEIPGLRLGRQPPSTLPRAPLAVDKKMWVMWVHSGVHDFLDFNVDKIVKAVDMLLNESTGLHA